MDKKKILIIDDEENFCDLVKKNLELEGSFSIEIAHQGESGFNQAVEIKPDLILLDIIMPGVSGLEVLKRLKEDPATSLIPVIILTALEDEVSKSKAALLGNPEYLVKPVETTELKAKIKKVLENNKKFDEKK